MLLNADNSLAMHIITPVLRGMEDLSSNLNTPAKCDEGAADFLISIGNIHL